MLENVCENWIRILKEEKHRQLRMFFILWKVKETDILIDKPKCEKPKTVRTPENIAAVAESVCEAPSTSIHCHFQQFNISETSLRWILYKDLGMTPYKVQLVQELKPIDHPIFASLNGPAIFSDEAHFDLGGYVNKQICSIWAQKIWSHTVKSRRTQNEFLFGADFGPEP